jgi:hypothetical protein
MPHMVLAGGLELAAVAIPEEVHRWGRAVIKTEGSWRRCGAEALLVEGVVVEFARPLHPVALVAPHDGGTIVRLWPVAPVERTHAVQRWLGLLAAALQRQGAGPLTLTNIPVELWQDLGLAVAPGLSG